MTAPGGEDPMYLKDHDYPAYRKWYRAECIRQQLFVPEALRLELGDRLPADDEAG